MIITSPLRSFVRALARRPKSVPAHPDAVFEPRLALPRRIDDPVTAARLACDLLRNRTEDVTLALYLDDRHRVVGDAVVAVGWVQAARLSARSSQELWRVGPVGASSSGTSAGDR